MKLPVILIVLAGWLAAAEASGQVAVAVRYGGGDGSGHYMVGEITGRLRVAGRLYVMGGYEMLGGSWACVASPLSSISCGYDGYTLSLGGALPVIDRDRWYLAARATAGSFERTGRYGGSEFTGDQRFTVSAGVDAELAVVGPLRIQAGVAHRQIFDDVYEDAVGYFPHVTAFSAGLSLVFGNGAN